MGRDSGEQPTPDLFSTEMVRDGSPSPTSPIPATQPRADASSQRHVLPKNLRKAVKHLSDGELDLLHAEILEEMERRGRLPPSDQTTNRSPRADKSSHGRQEEAATVSLTRGQDANSTLRLQSARPAMHVRSRQLSSRAYFYRVKVRRRPVSSAQIGWLTMSRPAGCGWTRRTRRSSGCGCAPRLRDRLRVDPALGESRDQRAARDHILNRI